MSEAATATTIPQLWTSALQETQTHMQAAPHGNTEYFPGVPLPSSPFSMKKMVHAPAFQYTAAAASTFLLSFIALICIQPPFTFTDEPENKHETNKFSVTKAALYALGATVLGVVIVVALYIFSKKQKQQ